MGILDLGRYKGIVFAITGFLVFIAIILAVNHGKAGQFSDDVSAVKFLAEQREQPGAVYSAGVELAARLKSGQKIDEPLEALRKAAKSYDNALSSLANGGMITDGTGNVFVVPALTAGEAQTALANGTKLWNAYKAKLDPVLRFSGSPYAAPDAPAQAAKAASLEAAPVPLSPRGRRLQAALQDLNNYGSTSHAQLRTVMVDLTAQVEAASRGRSGTLRTVQVFGIVAAVLLLGAIFFYFARNLRKDEAISNRQRKETADILRTVNEGLFLLDKDLKVGSERSMALNNIFRREDFAGFTFDQLLKEIVPEKTLRTAMDYVALLWGDRVNEKLVKTINPLNEVEVHFDNASGGFDTHFLEFDFNRVKAEGSLSHLLVTVNDVTKRVMLSRELQESQEKAQAQLDLLLRILHVEPDNLTGFLTDADVSLKMVNSILKEPAREESAFRAKIDGIYRQVHAVKGEAAALGLKTVEQRAHAFEEALQDLKGRTSLSGSDFLPLVVKLDDLFNHLAQVREMLSRLVDLHQAIASRRGPMSAGTPQGEAEKVDRWLAGETDEPQQHDKTMSMKAPVMPAAEIPAAEPAGGAGLERTLADLAARVASSQSKQVALRCTGLESVPEAYR